jgi:hypothetical protein
MKRFSPLPFLILILSPSLSPAQTGHWKILTSEDNLTIHEQDGDQPGFSEKKRQNLIKKARKNGLLVDDILVAGVEPAPISISTAKGKCGGDKEYCKNLDTLIELTQASLKCPTVQWDGTLIAGNPMPGNSSYGIQYACIRNNIQEVLEQAKTLFKDDRNLDWIAGALALNADCIGNRNDHHYCDLPDFNRRTAFAADLLAQLKTGARGVHFQSSSKIHLASEDVSLAETPPEKGQSEYEQIIFGGYMVDDINPRQTEYSGKEVVIRPDGQFGVMYPKIMSANDYHFAVSEMQTKCGQLKGELILQTDQGAGKPHVGVLGNASERFVYYLGSCWIHT